MKENWTTDMRQKLEGHKMAPPSGLWEGISSEMGLQKEPALITIAIKRWHWVVAAMVLALVGFLAVYQFNQNEPIPQVAHTSQKQGVPTAKVVSQVSPKTPVVVNQPNPVETVQEVLEDTNPQMPEETEPQQVSEGTTQQSSVVNNQQTYSEGHHYTSHHQNKLLSTSTSDRQWSVGLNASSGLLVSSGQRSTRQIGYPEYISDNNSGGIVSYQPSTLSYDDKAKHRLPFSFGLSVQYQLNSRLALVTGISYTYLYSEFSNPLYPQKQSEQKLHYLGVPAGLSWQFWKTNGVTLYLSGSFMLQKCLNENPWQWSVNASAGAEYAITPQLGLYLEPSLGYYFHDGTSFEHYYKEHPLSPSIELGIRLHISGK